MANPPVHEIHTSERKSFKGCRLRWDFHFRQNWTPIGMAPPLEFGIAYHKGMEVLYDPETWTWDKQVTGELAVKTFVDECRKQKEKYLRESEEPALEPAVEEEYQERIELGKGMLRYFYQKQLIMYPESMKPVKVEIKFEVPITDPETGEQMYCKCDPCWDRWIAFAKEQNKVEWDTPAKEVFYVDSRGLWKGNPVVYAGRLDCLMEDANGDYWVVDWKTARSISSDDEFLDLDDQIGSYVWAMWKLGLPIRGFIYHEQKKGFPKRPNQNVNIRKGCKFSVSKSQDTDYDTYLKTVQEEDPEAFNAGFYDDFLFYLQNEGITFHKRWQIIKPEQELINNGKDIYLEACDMLDPGLRIYRNSGRFSCKWCAFRQPCLGRQKGEEYTYALETLFRKEEPYYYRQERGPSTESKGGE